MDFKRAQGSAVQSPNRFGNPLIQPLISISKASTPVRTRLVQNGPPLNSTPVNINKLSQKNPMYTNKENNPYNVRYDKECNIENRQQDSKKQGVGNIERHYQSQKLINLSPVMALHRNIKQGLKHNQFQKSPTRFCREECKGLTMGENTKVQKQHVYLQNSKQYSTLKNSNSFKTILEEKANKTPPRLGSMAFGSLSKKDIGSDSKLLFTSNNFAFGFKANQETKILESKSQGRIMMKSPRSTQNQLQCMNNHGQKARYKVSKKQNQLDDTQTLVYCSRCAIALVQQGFSVQDLTKNDINSLLPNQKKKLQHNINDEQINLMKKQLKQKMEDLRVDRDQFIYNFQKQLDQVDCFYNSIISMIEQQRVKDRQTILSIRNNGKGQPQKYERQILQIIEGLQNKTNNSYFSNSEINNQINNAQLMIQKKIQYPSYEKIIEGSIQQYFDNFTVIFENQIKLKIGNNKIPKQSSLRFSFDKLSDHKNIRNPIHMNILKQQFDQQMEGQYLQQQKVSQKENNAFRNLFPDEQSSNQSQQNRPVKSPTFKQF